MTRKTCTGAQHLNVVQYHWDIVNDNVAAGPDSAVGSVSRLEFRSSQVRVTGPTPFTCQLLVKELNTEYWLTTLVKSVQKQCG